MGFVKWLEVKNILIRKFYFNDKVIFYQLHKKNIAKLILLQILLVITVFIPPFLPASQEVEHLT